MDANNSTDISDPDLYRMAYILIVFYIVVPVIFLLFQILHMFLFEAGTS